MLDIQFIRDNKDLVKKACKDKGVVDVVDKLLAVDKKRRILIQKIDKIRAQRNLLSQNIKQKPDKKTISQGRQYKKQLAKLESNLRSLKIKFNDLLLRIPNVPNKKVPIGKDESGNKEIKTWGKPPKFNFQPKDHIQLARDLDLIDFDRGNKVAGFRGYFLKNDGALLHLAVLQFALNFLIKKGFTPMIPPIIVKERAMINSAHFPWGKVDVYKTFDDEEEKDERFLAGTAEVPLVSYHQDEILSEKDLPLKYAGFSPCYRREIGSYGKDTKGIYRIHEFMKVEQVILSKNDWQESEKWHEALRNYAEELLQKLKLPYRVLLMCTGDMGEPQVKKYDIETWMPGRKAYGETMSDSIMGEFQSRRANIRYKTKKGEIKYVHMLNNTALASPRILIAILENYQQKNGSVKIPGVLQKYFNKKIIKNPA